MAVKTREELLNAIKARIGEQTDDDTISFIEDVSDTLSDLETKAKGDGEDWKTKFEENDKDWRKKYTERFFSSEPTEPPTEPPTELPKAKNFDELFTVKE